MSSAIDANTRDYMCQLCDQKFSTAEQLDQHNAQQHPTARKTAGQPA